MAPEHFLTLREEMNFCTLPGIQSQFIDSPVCILVTIPTEVYDPPEKLLALCLQNSEAGQSPSVGYP